MIIILVLALISFSFAQDTLIRWEEEVNLSQDTVYNFYPWVECKNSYIHIVWKSAGYVHYRHSSDFGVTWDSIVQLNDSSVTVIYPQIALADSFVHCVWWEVAQDGRLRYRRSTDRGHTWDSLCVLGPSAHRHFIIARDTNVYVITGKGNPDLGLFLLKSSDGGVSWSSYHKISSRLPDYKIGFVINEKFHIAFVDDADSVYYMYSTDLGETWSDPLQIAINPDAPKCRNIVANDYGYLFIPWSDNKYSGGVMDDILLRRSTDSGLTWLPEQQITNHHLVKYWDDICCTDSDVYLVWPKGGSEDALQFRASTDMGETWWEIEDIMQYTGYNEALEPSICSDSLKIHVAWRDYQGAPTEIYYKRGTRLPVGIMERETSDQITRNMEVLPNPFSEKTNIRYMIQDTGSNIQSFSLKIYDITGKVVVVLGHQNIRESGYQGNQVVWNGRDKNELQVPAGVYFVQVKTGNECIIKKVVKLK